MHTVHTALRVPTALTVPRVPLALAVPTVPTALTASIATTATSATTASTPLRGSTLLVRIPKVQSRKGVQSVQFSSSSGPVSSSSVTQSSQTVEQVTQSKSSSRSLFIRSFDSFCGFDSVKVGSDQSLRLLQHKGLHLSDWQSESEQDQGNPHTQRRY